MSDYTGPYPEPQNEHEMLIYMGAYIAAVNATIEACKTFGIFEVEKIHNKTMSDLAREVYFNETDEEVEES